MATNMRHGGKILVDQLVAQGVRRVFSVPGESFLAVLDGLHDSGIRNVVCRHEGGASFMAEATGKLTGRPGIAFVTRGPGATNAACGVHVARQDSTPMILFVGQIARSHRDREAFQEVDYRAFFGPIAKWAAEVDDIRRLPEYVSRAFHVAMSGRPGPVVLALPEDMLSEAADVPDPPPAAIRPAGVSPVQAAAVAEKLAAARLPLMVLGGPHWSPAAQQAAQAVASAWGLPMAVSFRRQDRVDARHPNYCGYLGVGMNPRLARVLREADCLLLIGTRLGDTATDGYELVDPAAPGKTVLHVHADPDEPGRVWRPDVAVTATAPEFLEAFRHLSPPAHADWSDWTAAARAGFTDWTRPRPTPGAVQMEEVVAFLSEHLGDAAIVTNGAGNFAAFVHRYLRPRPFPGHLAPTSGSMGYGVPAAIAAALECPGKTVVCVAGDGDFQMTLNELSTARQEGMAPVFVVANNGQYGTIRMHQERTYPGRVSGTQMFNPDYPALARAYGMFGALVERTADFAPAFAAARASGLAAVIELRLDPEALATGLTLAAARAEGEAKRR